MAVQKNLRFEYEAKNFTTGLTDVRAQIYLNGVAKAVAGSAINATPNANGSRINEVSSANAPGLYEILITAADLTAWGVDQSTAFYLVAYVNSASKSAPATFRRQEMVADVDDIDVKLGTPAGASVSADIASIKSDTTAIKSDLETGPNSLANLMAALAGIAAGTGVVAFAVPQALVINETGEGNNVYTIPIRIYDEEDRLKDPDSDNIDITLVNQAGTDRSAYLTSGATAVKDDVGKYHIVVTLPDTAPEEELIFGWDYEINSNPASRVSTTNALKRTSTELDEIETIVEDIQSVVNDPVFGNQAIKNAVNAVQAELDNEIEGAGFNTTTDSLAAISARIYNGGRAV